MTLVAGERDHGEHRRARQGVGLPAGVDRNAPERTREARGHRAEAVGHHDQQLTLLIERDLAIEELSVCLRAPEQFGSSPRSAGEPMIATLRGNPAARAVCTVSSIAVCSPRVTLGW